MFSPIIRSQENDIVSVNKAIIETHVVARCHKNYSRRIIKRKYTIRVHYKTEIMSRLLAPHQLSKGRGFSNHVFSSGSASL